MTIAEADLKQILSALAFAAHKHRDCRRKNAEASPYINHPISLANILCNEGHIADVNVICGALLHDTVEDTDATEEELRNEFGDAITDIVMDVTDDKSLLKHERKEQQVAHASHIRPEAKLVKLADKISNLRDVAHDPPPDWDLQRRRQYFDWAKRVIDQLRGVHPELERIFDQAIANRP
jgi:guanosine-3',5'-bis(diphosphate) 3'-pyrophosphohydrolase